MILLSRSICIYLPQAVLRAGLQISHQVQVDIKGLVCTSQLLEHHLSSSGLRGLHGDHCGPLLSLLGPVLLKLLLVFLSHLLILGPDLDICLQQRLSDTGVSVMSLSTDWHMASFVSHFKVIRNKMVIVSLEDDVGTVHGVGKDLSSQVLNGLEITPSVSDLRTLLLRVLPDFVLQLPILSFQAPHSVQVGGQAVVQALHGLLLILDTPLTRQTPGNCHS